MTSVKSTKIKSLFKAPICAALLCALASSCSSVFTAGAGGRVADAESSSNPKDGIEGVEIYAYTDESARDSDYEYWVNSVSPARFSPSESDEYVGRSVSSSDGSFSISKLVWETTSPKYGKTADYCSIYLLFYHELYGLVKNDSPVQIISDSSSSNIYQEMTKIRKSTDMQIAVVNVSDNAALTDAVTVRLSVPQGSSAAPTVYEETITGSGTITISYPRYDSDAAYTPRISASVYQGGSDYDWKMCNNAGDDYSFIEVDSDGAAETPVTNDVSGTTAPLTLYVKPVTISMPSISGQLLLTSPTTGSAAANRGDEGTSADDNVAIFLCEMDDDGNITALSDSSARVKTAASGTGANDSVIRHGLYGGLGAGVTWRDEDYADRIASYPGTLVIAADVNGDNAVGSGDYYVKIEANTAASSESAATITTSSSTIN